MSPRRASHEPVAPLASRHPILAPLSVPCPESTSSAGARSRSAARRLWAAPAHDDLCRHGAEGGTRTPMRLPSTVFETVASAIPPLRPAPYCTQAGPVVCEDPASILFTF